MKNIIKVNNDILAVGEDGNTYTTKDMLKLSAMVLVEDLSKFRKGKKKLSEQIILETNAVTALTEAVKAL